MVLEAAPAGIGRLKGTPSTIGEAPPPAALSKPFLLNIIRIFTSLHTERGHDKRAYIYYTAAMSMNTTGKVTALLLAGKRSGALDPLAENSGAAQKCVVPVAGKPLIEHTALALSECANVGEIRIVAHEADEIAAIPLIARLVAEGRVTFHSGAHNLVDSIFAGARGAAFPMIVTTADNCLWKPADYAEFIDHALAATADAGAALARKEDVQAADPRGQAKFYQFADGGFSNCNTYWVGNENALRAAEVMRGGGQFVKHPARIAKAFGVMNLVRFYLGNGTREKLFGQVGRRMGLRMEPVVMSNGYCAIDVDNQRTWEVTDRLLRERAPSEAG